MRARGAVVGLALVAGALAPPGPAGAAAQAACPGDVPPAGFSDVAADDVHAGAIDCVVDWEIARGASPTAFAPAAQVTRGQLASFVARTLRRSGGQLAASPPDRFGDDDSSAHHYSINRLAEAGVVQGSAGRFAADTGVSRAQVAALLVRTYEHRTGRRLPDAPDAFTDDDASVHEDSIDRAAAAGFTRGTGRGTFAPDAPVSRAQLASFLARTLEAVVATGVVEQTPDTLRRASALEGFEACDPLLGHLKERAVEQVGAWGWGYGHDDSGGAPVGGPTPRPATPESGGGDAGGGGGPSYSGTNNQEADVDEADVVKTDGRTLWSLVDGQLRAVDVTGAEPRLAGTLDVPFGYGAELLVAGTRGLVLSSSWSSAPGPGPASDVVGPGFGRPATTVTWVDLSDPAAMRVEGSLEVDGTPVAARLASGVARVVVRSGLPDLPFTTPRDGSAEAVAEAAQANRRAVETSTIVDWLPRYRLEDRRPEPALLTESSLYACTELQRPPEHSGLGTINVLTLDPALPPHAGQTAGVLADGDLVYASARSLYVATTRWDTVTGAPTPDPRITTALHAFSLADRQRATYRASGKVEGMLLNQFAMSEHEGRLRVATTSRPLWWGGLEGSSESSVVVLAEQGTELTPVGQVGGLGVGEVIRAVRFLGDTAYVVTFRQTDPLYTVDLSDPTAPRVVGELKVLGYSAYLHPLGEDLLLGVGQDATEEGELRGTQLSLFDVSDPAAPQRLHAHALGEGSGSDVEFDHRAFLHWPATGLTVLPLSRWSVDEATGEQDSFVGAVGVEVDAADGFRTLGEVTHGSPDDDGSGDTRWPGIRRSVVVGDAVYTLSERGVMGSDLTTLAERSWLPLPQR